MSKKSISLLMGLTICGMLAWSVVGQVPPPQPATQPTTRGARGGRGAGARGPANPAPQVMAPRDYQPYTPNNYESLNPMLPTLVVAGDSTAQTGDDAWHRGWGALLVDYFDASKLNLVNPSIGGRSFRTFTKEGRWDRVVANIKPGDWVFIQMGHNDGNDGGPVTAGGRTELPGLGEEMQEVTGRDGQPEIVHTFGWYARKWIKETRDKGATPVMMSQTIYNRWKDGKYARSEPHIYDWAKQSAINEKTLFLDHTRITSDLFERIGQDAVRPYYAADPLHTTTYGATVQCETFIAGIKQLDIKPLVDALNDKGKAIEAWKPAIRP